MRKNGKMMPCEHCGKEVYIYKARQKAFRFCSQSCHGKTILCSPKVQAKIKRKYGKEHHNWKGGTINKERGYRLVCVRGKQVYEHRYIMEQHLGRKLDRRENVHHINGDKLDNRIDNLELIDVGEHIHKCHPRKRNEENYICVDCKRCGKEFETYKHRLKTGRGKYCSKKCLYNH